MYSNNIVPYKGRQSFTDDFDQHYVIDQNCFILFGNLSDLM